MRIDRDQTAAWADAGLSLARAPSRAALVALADDRAGLPPPAFVADLAWLAGGGRLDHRAVPGWARPFDSALARYEDRVLAPLAGDPQLLACGDALARLSPADRPAGAALLAALVLDRLGVTGLEVDVATLRREAPAASPTAPAVAALAAGYAELVTAAHLAPRRWILPSDAGLIAAAPSLRRLGARLRLRALVDAALALADVPWPRPRARPRGGSSIAAPGELAVGGYADLVPGSRLDGLVASELVFLGDPDLFLPRYAEGSLLAFQRDEGLRRHPRYDLVVTLDPSTPLAAIAAAVVALVPRRLLARLTLLGEHPDLPLATTLVAAVAPAAPPPVFAAGAAIPRADRVAVAGLSTEPRRAVAQLLEALG